jgi:hypothetical protein
VWLLGVRLFSFKPEKNKEWAKCQGQWRQRGSHWETRLAFASSLLLYRLAFASSFIIDPFIHFPVPG